MGRRKLLRASSIALGGALTLTGCLSKAATPEARTASHQRMPPVDGEATPREGAEESTSLVEEEHTVAGPDTDLPTFHYESELQGAFAHQGVAADGTYLYTTTQGHGDDGLYKLEKDGTVVDHRPNPFMDGTRMMQVTDLYYHPDDGLLYGGANNFNNPVGDSQESWVKVWDPTDLSYVTEHDVPNNGLAEGVMFAHGSWWVIYADADFITELDTGWNVVANHPFAYRADQPDGNSYNGLWWEGDYLYTTRHNGKTPEGIEVHRWDGSTLTAEARLEKPHPDVTQGMHKEPGSDIMWFCARGGGGLGTRNDNVVKTRFSHTNGKPDGV